MKRANTMSNARILIIIFDKILAIDAQNMLKEQDIHSFSSIPMEQLP